VAVGHDRGYGGEQSMGFFLGQQGYFFVEGPSGAGGHAATASGFDGVAYHPANRHLIIYDNKSFARSGNISSATAIDAEKNLLQNLDRLIARVQGVKDLPHKDNILSLLNQTRQAVQAVQQGQSVKGPSNVTIAVSNAGGQSTGVGGRLSKSGVQFIDYNAAPKPAPAGGQSKPSVAPRSVTPPAGRLGAGVRALGGSLAMLGISILANLLRAKLEQSRLEDAMKKLEPKIREKLEGQAVRVLEIQSAGRKAFGIVTIVVVEHTAINIASGNMMSGLLEVQLTDVTIGDKEAPREKAKGELRMERNPIGNTAYQPYTYSFELAAFPKEQVDVYRALKQELQWYEDQLTNNPTLAPQDRSRLSLDKIKVEQKIRAWTHPPAANYSEFNPPFVIKLDSAFPALANTQALPGSWLVKVRQFEWIYHFEANGVVRWRDPNNLRAGRGSWKAVNSKILVDWSPASATKEEWALPISVNGQSGNYVDKSGATQLTAHRIDTSEVQGQLVGRWRVQVHKWTWIYDFDANGGVRWTDPFNNKTGKGSWELLKASVLTTWTPVSNTTEQWFLPLNPANQTGKCVMKEGVFQLKATKA